jgi:phytanoyl-CoA hydroxylase
VTFHHGRTAHRANANDTDEYRVAHTVIYMPRTTTYAGTGHCVTDGQGFTAGQVLAGDLFPEI